MKSEKCNQYEDMQQVAESIGLLLGYQFKNFNLLRRALTHPSAVKDASDSYQTLEFIGDKILAALVANLIFVSYPNSTEQDLTLRFVSVTRGSFLASLAEDLELNKFIIFGIGEARSASEIKSRAKAMEDVLESVIGAIFKDSGFVAATKVVNKLFLPRIKSLVQIEKDQKSAFQEELQKRFNFPPKYQSRRIGGFDHKPVFLVYTEIKRMGISFFAVGSSIKDGQRKLANYAIEYMRSNK